MTKKRAAAVRATRNNLECRTDARKAVRAQLQERGRVAAGRRQAAVETALEPADGAQEQERLATQAGEAAFRRECAVVEGQQCAAHWADGKPREVTA